MTYQPHPFFTPIDRTQLPQIDMAAEQERLAAHAHRMLLRRLCAGNGGKPRLWRVK